MDEFTRRVVVVSTALVLLLACWYLAEVFLLAFAGILLAVFLNALAQRVAARLHLRRGWAFALVIAALSAAAVLLAMITFPRITEQFQQLQADLPHSLDRLRGFLRTMPWGERAVALLPRLLEQNDLPQRAAYALIEALEYTVVILVVGVYLAADPDLYVNGAARLLPRKFRRRGLEWLHEAGYTLWWWLLGQMLPMAVLGVGTYIGLRLLDIPLALILSLFTAVMIFIPYAGAILSTIPALMIALLQGPLMVVYVLLIYVAVHIVEGYLLTPLVQRRAVLLPPALTILAQVAMWVLAGFLGLALATPLAAAGLVLVRIGPLHEKPQHQDLDAA